MLDRIITWLIKRLILLWDRHNDKIAFSFGRDENTENSTATTAQTASTTTSYGTESSSVAIDASIRADE